MSESAKFDWEAVRERLAKAEAGLANDAKYREKVFKARAERLATRLKKLPGRQVNTLVFVQGGERVAFEVPAVREVLLYRGCTPLPGAPMPVLGVLSHQGEIYTVLDLAHILAVDPPDPNAPTFVMLMKQAGIFLGLRVGTVQGIELLPEDELGDGAANALGIGGDVVKGMWPDSPILLDTETILRPFR